MANDVKNAASPSGEKAKTINFAYKNIRAACDPAVDMDGHKQYRTVFRADEMATLYVDTEFVNLQYGRKTWKAELECFLFGMDGEQATLVAHKAGELEIPSTEPEVNLATDFTAEDYAGHWSAGHWVIACGPDGVQAKRRGLRQGQGISAGLRIISLRCRVLVRWRVYLYTNLL